MTKVVGMPADFVASAHEHPQWGPTEAIAHSLATTRGSFGGRNVDMFVLGPGLETKGSLT